jgi:class 3 adenylate cyclase/tetratricopeptide (TPR) repeat protein
VGVVDLSSLLPRHLAERVLEGRAELEGERKVVTVMFADLTGSTSLGAQLDPEDLVELLNALFTRWVRAVHAYEGTVDKFLGDGMLALFGAPLAHEDDPRRAVLAALAVRDATRAQAIESGLHLDVRIGLNTGSVVVGTVGSDARMEYTAIGDAVNAAQRIEAAAEPGTIFVGEETAKLVRSYFALRPAGTHELRGRGEMELTEVVGDLGVTATVRGVEGLSSGLVGRDDELRRLVGAIDRAAEGIGSVIGLVAEPGVGKSRLISEVRKRARSIPWAQGHALSFGSTTPYLPIAELVESLDQVDTELSELLAGGGDGSEVSRERVMVAVRRAVAAASPAVVVVEDLHWADASTLDVLAVLATGDLPIALILTSRPEGVAVAERLGAEMVWIEPLDAARQHELVSNLVGSETAAALIGTVIAERCAGNPFYTEEYLREMIDSGLLVAGDTGWTVATEQLPGVPRTVQAVVAARIDRLSGPARRTLHAGSVLGSTFSVDLVAALLEDEPDVGSLVDGGFVVDAPTTGEFVFRHAITQDVAYASMLKRTRRRLHLQAADALAALAGDQELRAADLGRHYDLGGRGDLAAPHLLVAARRSAAAYANDAALDLAGRIIELTDDPALLFDAFEVQSRVLGHVGRHDEELRAVAGMRSQAGADRRRLLMATEAEIRAGIGAGFLETYAICEQAVAESQAVDDPLLRGRLLEMWATLQMRQYSPARAIAPLDEAVGLFARAGAHRLRALALSRLAGALRLVDPVRAGAVTIEAMAAAREADDPKLLTLAHYRQAMVDLTSGRLERAIAGYAEVLALASDIGDMTMVAEGNRLAAHAAALVGDVAAAEAQLLTALEVTKRTGNTHGWLFACMSLVEQWEAQQRFARAHAWLTEMESEVASWGQPANLSYIHYALGYRTLRWFHALDEAEDRLRAALAITGEDPEWMPPAVMYRNGLAMVLIAGERPEEAEALLSEARQLVDEYQLDEVTGTYLLVTSALLGLKTGDVARARMAIDGLTARLFETETDEEHQAVAILEAELALAEARPGDAVAHARLAASTEPLMVNGRWFSSLHAACLVARAADAAGQESQSLWAAALADAERHVAAVPAVYREEAWRRPDLASIRRSAGLR